PSAPTAAPTAAPRNGMKKSSPNSMPQNAPYHVPSHVRSGNSRGLGYFSSFFTAGGFQVPSRIDGSFSFGQYIRSVRMNGPLGAGSQLASLSVPGDSFWKYS